MVEHHRRNGDETETVDLRDETAAARNDAPQAADVQRHRPTLSGRGSLGKPPAGHHNLKYLRRRESTGPPWPSAPGIYTELRRSYNKSKMGCAGRRIACATARGC